MESIQMIQKAFRDDAIRVAQIKVWHKHFKDGRESVESDSHSGRPSTNRTPENVECLQAAVNKDRWLTVWELEADLGIPKLLCPRFWCRILAWNVLWQNLFCGFCYQSRRNIVNDLTQTATKWTRFTQEGHNRRWMVGLQQGCQTHFHQELHQPCSCLQKAKCNFRTV